MLYYLLVASWMVISGALIIYVLKTIKKRQKQRFYEENSPAKQFEEWKPAPWMKAQTNREPSKLDAIFDELLGTKKNATKRSQYQKKFTLLNKSELVLFGRLREAAPELLTLTQVSMSQLFFIGNFRKDGYRQIGEIGRKSIDFLICRPDTSIVLAIELNGPTHNYRKQLASDEKKRAALEEAGIPLIVIPANKIPDVMELKNLIAPHIVERKMVRADRDASVQKEPLL